MGRKSLHSKQFREEACKLVSHEGYSVGEAAKQLGLPRNTLWNWLTEHGQHSLASQALDKKLGDDPRLLKARIKELEERVVRLETEKEILKKATAYFAREEREQP
jgi:transposase